MSVRAMGVLGGLVAGIALAAAGCGDDEDIHDADPGVVEAKPANAQQVDVVLREWAVEPKTQNVAAGEIYFLADNQGPNDPHELVIVRSDLEPGRLPVKDGRVPEDAVDLIGEIEPFAVNSKASRTVRLTPGNYVLLCNIAEMEDGALESHYALGMWSAFRVQ